MADPTTQTLIEIGRDHCRSALASYTNPDRGLGDVLAAIEAAQCSLAVAADNIRTHLRTRDT